MAEIAGFFDAVAGVPTYAASDMNAFLAVRTAKDGIAYGYLNSLTPSNSGSQTTNFDTGGAFFGGMIYRNTTSASLVSSTVTNTKMRYDVFVIRFDAIGGTANLTIIQGVEASSNPAVPSINSATDILVAKLLIDRTSGTVYTFTDQRDFMTPVGATNEPNNFQLIRNLFWGLNIANVSTTSFSVAAGAIADDTFAHAMYARSSYTKTTASFSPGTSAGGLDAGSIASSTWYYVYLIMKADLVTWDILYSTSSSLPTMPSDFIWKSIIGAVHTDGSSHFDDQLNFGGGQITHEYVSNTSSTDAADTTSFTLNGSVGIIRTTALTTVRKKRIQWRVPKVVGDLIFLELWDGNGWIPYLDATVISTGGQLGSVMNLTSDTGAGSGGMGRLSVSTTTDDICFGVNATVSSAGSGLAWNSTAFNSGTKWRAHKIHYNWT